VPDIAAPLRPSATKQSTSHWRADWRNM
jgi:hypothetical protein